MNIEILKQYAEEFKADIDRLIETTKKYDLAFLESVGCRSLTEKEVDVIQSNLRLISKSYAEMRLIDEFVEHCEFRSSEKTQEVEP